MFQPIVTARKMSPNRHGFIRNGSFTSQIDSESLLKIFMQWLQSVSIQLIKLSLPPLHSFKMKFVGIIFAVIC